MGAAGSYTEDGPKVRDKNASTTRPMSVLVLAFKIHYGEGTTRATLAVRD